MKSRTSFCNAALLKKALRRGLPIWVIYLIGWINFLPMRLLTSSGWMSEIRMKNYVLEAAVANSHILPALFGLASACLVFSYLYKARSANFFAALPLRRETHFVTNYVAGLLYTLLPNLIVSILTLVAGAVNGAVLLREVLIWFGISALAYGFFYNFAVLCAMLVGHLAALPILYAVLNFTVVVIESIVRALLSTFVFGLYFNGNNDLTVFSPLWHLLSGGMPDVVSIRENNVVVGYNVEKWEYLAVLFAVGLVFAALAFLLRKGRRMESAGDVIAVNRLKPVFLYCFTIGCSLVIGYVLAAFLGETSTTNFLPLLICMLVGAFLGFFGGQMMLHKSLRIFRKKYWISFAVICAVITAVMLCCRLDLLGYSRYVPDADEVKAISLDYGDTEYSEDPKLIAMTVELHQDILAQRDVVEQATNGTYQVVYLNYQLNSGKKVLRRYTIPIGKATDAVRPDSLIRRYEAIYNDPDYLLRKVLPGSYGPEDISHAVVWNWLNSEIVLSSEKAYDLLKNGIEPDIRAGVLEYRTWTDGEPTATKEEYTELNLHFEVIFENTPDRTWSGRYCSFSLNKNCVNSLKILEEWGIDTTPDPEMTEK